MNRGSINQAAYQVARSAAHSEIQTRPEFHFLSNRDADIMTGMSLTDRHNLNSSDASILEASLHYARSVEDICVLIASDARLLRAATAEGLATLNPEQIAAADVAAFLSSLSLVP